MLTAMALIATLQVTPVPDAGADDWTYQVRSSAAGMTMFTRRFSGPGPRLWVRFEFSPDQPGPDGARSVRQLIEAKCSDGTWRVIQQDSFSEPNLHGVGYKGVPTEWAYPAPDTFAEYGYQLICGAPGLTPER